MASVDIFGQQLGPNVVATAGARGPPGVGFDLTADFQYDMQEKRLCNVGNPKLTTDAATLQTVRDVVNEKLNNTQHLVETIEKIDVRLTNIEKTEDSTAIEALISTFNSDREQERTNYESLYKYVKKNTKFIAELNARVQTLESKK